MARPILYGIPFSHYCQKAEWALTQAGIPYDYVSISLKQMVDLPKFTESGLVPFMEMDGRIMEGSDVILDWAANHQADGTQPLIPKGQKRAVKQWESWAGDEVGPVARREAYRVAHSNPMQFTRKRSVRILAYLGKGLILNILKFYKARRYDASDKEAVPVIVDKIANALNEQGTGYLLGKDPTAADISVAALARPLLYAAPGRDYHELAGWRMVRAFIDGMIPDQTTRASKRRIKAKDWERIRSLRGSD